MRKVFEAMQAWRRGHGGEYPPNLATLVEAGLLPLDGEVCPDELAELRLSDSGHSLQTSRGEGKDREDAYEYELSKVAKKEFPNPQYVPEGFRPTRFEVKAPLFRRPFFEQVPMLRCTSHEDAAAQPEVADEFGDPKHARRNLPVTGDVYWSGDHWEFRWVDDVPYPAREAPVLFGLKGPPFHSGAAIPPSFSGAVDLKPWTNAFGDSTWWWTLPFFGTIPHPSATLNRFFNHEHGRKTIVGEHAFWVDGLVQLQGEQKAKITHEWFRYPGVRSFPWERRDLPVGRRCKGARWIQGTAWDAEPGEVAGWIEFIYADGEVERVSIVVGRDTGRFWERHSATGHGEDPLVEPVWRHVEEGVINGEDREHRLFEQAWRNPRPDVEVARLNFVSNRESTAAPFLVALTLDL